MDLASFGVNKRLISALATVLILLLGYRAYELLPRFEDPEFVIRQAKLITPYAGATAEEVEEEVTEVVETALQQLSGVKEITSTSYRGRSEITIEFEIADAKSRADLNQRFSQLRAKVLDCQSRIADQQLHRIVADHRWLHRKASQNVCGDFR